MYVHHITFSLDDLLGEGVLPPKMTGPLSLEFEYTNMLVMGDVEDVEDAEPTIRINNASIVLCEVFGEGETFDARAAKYAVATVPEAAADTPLQCTFVLPVEPGFVERILVAATIQPVAVADPVNVDLFSRYPGLIESGLSSVPLRITEVQYSCAGTNQTELLEGNENRLSLMGGQLGWFDSAGRKFHHEGTWEALRNAPIVL